jgi:hypothetical protein
VENRIKINQQGKLQIQGSSIGVVSIILQTNQSHILLNSKEKEREKIENRHGIKNNTFPKWRGKENGFHRYLLK